MAAHNYFPISQSWAPGQWSAGNFIIALLLCIILIGILVFIYMLVVKPNGTLTVTYERRAASVEVMTCPRCAEQIKAAALVCHFCGQEFASEEVDEAPQISIDRGSLLEPPRKRNIKALIVFFVVLGITIGVAAISISDRSLKPNAPSNITAVANLKEAVAEPRPVPKAEPPAAPIAAKDVANRQERVAVPTQVATVPAASPTSRAPIVETDAIIPKPSFDCAKAKTAAARLICSDAELAGLDGDLGRAFRKRKAEMPAADQSKLVSSQLAWLKERNTRCGLIEKNDATLDALATSKPCLINAMRERVTFLGAN